MALSTLYKFHNPWGNWTESSGRVEHRGKNHHKYKGGGIGCLTRSHHCYGQLVTSKYLPVTRGLRASRNRSRVRLVVQRLNHCATPGPHLAICNTFILQTSRKEIRNDTKMTRRCTLTVLAVRSTISLLNVNVEVTAKYGSLCCHTTFSRRSMTASTVYWRSR